MKVSIVKKTFLEGISSASGLEVINGILYIISDDSSMLYKVKHDLTLLEKVELYPSNTEHPEHIPKPIKADLECLGQLSINGYKHLLVLGSGSKSPERDKGFLIKLPTNYNRKHIIQEIDLGRLYSLLRSDDVITTNGEINIEGLAFGDENVYLLNRGNPSGSQNVVLSFSKIEFTEFVQGHMDGVPFPKVHPVDLPMLSDTPLGFTGADYFDQKFWYTCAAEDTNDAYQDGQVLGSKVGLLNIAVFDNGRYAEEKLTIGEIVAIQGEEGDYNGKVESISVFEIDQKGHYSAVAVTDSDGGPSELLLFDIAL